MSDPLERLVLGACNLAPPVRGKTAVGWRLMKRAERNGTASGALKVSLRDGTKLELPRAARESWRVAADRAYDRVAVGAIERYIKPNTAVLDVGASLGLLTVQLGRIARAHDAHVHAFEPNPANLPWLDRNIELNNLAGHVTVHPTALGDTREILSFHSLTGVGNGQILAGELTDEGFIAVPVIPLDEVDISQPVSLMKMDVEGYELAVLRGAARLLERDHPTIYGEFSGVLLQQREESVESFLADGEYEAFRLSLSRSRPWRTRDRVAIERCGGALADDLLLRPTGRAVSRRT